MHQGGLGNALNQPDTSVNAASVIVIMFILTILYLRFNADVLIQASLNKKMSEAEGQTEKKHPFLGASPWCFHFISSLLFFLRSC